MSHRSSMAALALLISTASMAPAVAAQQYAQAPGAVDALPRSATDKVLKNVLRERFS